MTLEDFFTLTEMKNGLTALARVEELISVMQQQKDCVMSNASDAARQWSSVASTLIATENKDCLDHFVKLNGLFYLNHWLQEAVKCNNEIAGSAVEALLNSILGSLERLPINREDSISSGIQSTIEQLVTFKSLDVKEKAIALSERWKLATKNGDTYQGMNKDEKCQDGSLEPTTDAVTVDVVNLASANSAHIEDPEETREESATSGGQSHYSSTTACKEASPIENTGVLPSTEIQSMPAGPLNSLVQNANLEDKDALDCARIPNSCQQNISGTGNSTLCPKVERASSSIHCSNAPGDVTESRHNVSEPKDEDMKMEVDTSGDILSKAGQSKNFPSPSGISVSSHAQKPGRSVSCNFDVKELMPDALDTVQALTRSASIDYPMPKYLKNMDLKPDLQGLLNNGYKLSIKNDSETSLDSKEEVESPSEAEGVGCDSKLSFSRVDTVALHDISKPADKKSTVEMDERSELGLEYGEIDALEVARQVAIEVEREVVDYREPFCSSSPDDNPGEDTDPRCSDGQAVRLVNEEPDERGSPPSENLDHASSLKDTDLRSEETGIGSEKCVKDAEMSEPVSHEQVDATNNNRCVFDLNEDVCVEESDCLMNSTTNNPVSISAPIAVAASKRAPLLPVSPLRFEGELGWKGSAATSAFRPASPRRTPDTEKTSSSHKRKANLIEFDLNVADSGDDVIDPVSVKPVPASSSVPSQEDSAEVSSRRADRLKLDLNSLGEDDIQPPFQSSYWSLPLQNGQRTMSPASSSSSRQPGTKDFDLNDNPSYFDAMGSYNLSRFSLKAPGMHASSKPDNPFITIMGSKIAERKDYLNEAPLSLMENGPRADSAASMSRSVMPYGHIPLAAYGYNGHMMGPSMSFPPQFSGSIPYMMDSRAATFVPQLLTPPGLNTTSSAIPPFLMSVSNTSTGLNGVGTSQTGLDLNSGFMSLESGNRESGNVKNFFY